MGELVAGAGLLAAGAAARHLPVDRLVALLRILCLAIVVGHGWEMRGDRHRIFCATPGMPQAGGPSWTAWKKIMPGLTDLKQVRSVCIK